jgi:hypothetical protein
MTTGAGRWMVSVVVVCVVVGAWLRLSTLDRRSITHPEMYVPGICLPAGISEPAERLSIASVLTGTFSSDTHPPGYYLAMFPWTRLAGTSLRAIRIPSALLGIASIPLLYLLGVLIGRPGAGAVAATLMAFSGYHVFWSQVARMFALGCFLGLSATVLLLCIVRGARPRAFLTAVYVAVVLAGLSTHVFFWGLLGAHLLWTFGNVLGNKHLAWVCRAQLLALVLGSPLIDFAGYQSGNVVADLSRDVPRFFGDLVGFGFALPTRRSEFFPAAIPFTEPAAWWGLRAAITLTGGLLLIAGLSQLWRAGRPVLQEGEKTSGAWKAAWIAAGIFGALAIAGFIAMSSRLPASQLHSTIRITKALLPLPLVLAALALLVDARWARLPGPTKWSRLFQGEQSLVALLAIVPFGLLGLLSAFRPVLNQRGLIVVVPYMLLVLATGLVSLRDKVWQAVSWSAAAVALIAGLIGYNRMTVDPADYRRFAMAITPQIRPDDLVFVRKAWYETPIFYYLKPSQYSLVGRNFSQATMNRPEARVWAVMLYDDQPSPDMQTALTGYRIAQTISLPHTKAILYECPPAVAGVSAP